MLLDEDDDEDDDLSDIYEYLVSEDFDSDDTLVVPSFYKF